MARPSNCGKRNDRRGFVLITTAACIVGLLVLIGLATDVGHLFVARSELQVFVDEAAFAASFELDGTLQGITRARTMASVGTVAGAPLNLWDFGTQTVANASALFATAPGGPFVASPASATGYRFIRVQVTASVPMYFMPLIPTIAGTESVTVWSIAGQDQQLTIGDGAAPFSPDAHDADDPDFGFSPGQLYTLRWPPPGQRKKNSCSGDVGFTPGGGSSDRGYIDIGQGNGNSALRNAIVDNNYSLSQPLQIGSIINVVPGQKSVTSAMDERFAEDTDTTSSTFATYTGDGRRLLTVPVNDGGSPATVVGFALFFLQPSECGTKNTSPCCAEYVGPGVVSSSRKGAGTPGLYGVQLVQ